VDIFPTTSATIVTTSQGRLAFRIDAYFGDLFSGRAGDVGVFFSEAMQHGLELLICIMVFFLLHQISLY